MKTFFRLLTLSTLAGLTLNAFANPHQVYDCKNSAFEVTVGLSAIDAQNDRLSLTIFDNASNADSFEAVVPKDQYKAKVEQTLDFTNKSDPSAKTSLTVQGSHGTLVYEGTTITLSCE